MKTLFAVIIVLVTVNSHVNTTQIQNWNVTGGRPLQFVDTVRILFDFSTEQ